jgi:hypothetical protein
MQEGEKPGCHRDVQETKSLSHSRNGCSFHQSEKSGFVIKVKVRA